MTIPHFQVHVQLAPATRAEANGNPTPSACGNGWRASVRLITCTHVHTARSPTRVPGYTTGDVMVPVAADAAWAIRSGKNLIAVTCHQTKGGQAIDVGLVKMDKK